MNPSQFRKLLGKMKQYYHKVHVDIHDASNRSGRELTNIRDSNFISFRDNPKFYKYIRNLSEEQNFILNEKIAIEEEKIRRRLMLTSLHEGWVRRGIEERPHNPERRTFFGTRRRSSSRNRDRSASRSSSRNRNSFGGKRTRRR